MSFKCEKCFTQQPAGQPMNRVVIEQRPKSYTFTQGRGYKETTETASGWEIKREMAVCPTCYKEMTGLEPRQIQEAFVVKQPKKFFPREEEQKHPRRHGPFRNSERRSRRQEQRTAPIVEVVNQVRK